MRLRFLIRRIAPNMVATLNNRILDIEKTIVNHFMNNYFIKCNFCYNSAIDL